MREYIGKIVRVAEECEGRCIEVHGKEVKIVDVRENDMGRVSFAVEFIEDCYPPYIMAGHREEGWRKHELDFSFTQREIIWEV